MFDFTGYVLRWDEGIRWALLVGTNLIKTIPLIGARLYCALIGGARPRSRHPHPLLHLAHLRSDPAHGRHPGLAPVPRPPRWRHLRPAPRAALRPAPHHPLPSSSSAKCLPCWSPPCLLILVSLLVPAPLAPPIQAGAAPGQALSTTLSEVRAPWFFLWVQQLLRYGDAFWLGVALPLGVLLLLALLPYLFPHLPESPARPLVPPRRAPRPAHRRPARPRLDHPHPARAGRQNPLTLPPSLPPLVPPAMPSDPLSLSRPSCHCDPERE